MLMLLVPPIVGQLQPSFLATWIVVELGPGQGFLGRNWRQRNSGFCIYLIEKFVDNDGCTWLIPAVFFAIRRLDQSPILFNPVLWLLQLTLLFPLTFQIAMYVSLSFAERVNICRIATWAMAARAIYIIECTREEHAVASSFTFTTISKCLYCM